MSAALLFIGGQQADAASWRINSDATKKAHFLDINAAMASSEVAEGDTLYLDPGCNLTATQNVTKQVTIVGCGYFLDSNMLKQATIGNNLYLKASGIKMEGLEVTGTTYIAGGSNITMERCKLRSVFYNSSPAQYLTLRQCYIVGQVKGDGSSSTTTNGWTVENCIIFYSSYYDPICQLLSPVIRNNYICSSYSSAGSATIANFNNAIVVNNILINTKYMTGGGPYQCANSLITNNVTNDAATLTNWPNNVTIPTNTEASVFALEGTNDQRYRLKEDSPAKGAATDGGDCGPYSGLYPYVPSGYPLGMPRFESSSIPVRPQDGQVRMTQKVVLQGE